LRTGIACTLLLGVLILTSSCQKKNTALSSEQPQRREAPETAQGKKNIEVPLEQPPMKDAPEIEQAMELFYGNYDAKNQTSVALLPQWPSTRSEEQLTVKPLFHAFYGAANAQNLVLVTSAISPINVGHAAVPTIGMAVLSHKESEWTMDASNRAVTYSGEWGHPPQRVELVQIGPNHYAVELVTVGGGQGETTADLELLIPLQDTVNVGLDRIIADDDRGAACDLEAGLSVPCYENHREVSFIKDGTAEYYGLKLELTGTDLPTPGASMPKEPRPVHGVENLKFENGKYVQVSRQGDKTAADIYVAIVPLSSTSPNRKVDNSEQPLVLSNQDARKLADIIHDPVFPPSSAEKGKEFVVLAYVDETGKVTGVENMQGLNNPVFLQPMML
jgi:hypothetical protein